jgi:D-inositol-3-phosphate glycosyltransferase
VKGLDVLIHALPAVDQDIHLIIAGKPWKDDFTFYQSLIEKYQLSNRVKLFIRYIDDQERELFLKSADLLIIPYRKIYQSGVLLMGMSYRLPVLASDVEANRELIKDQYNGLLFKNGDPNDLAEKINAFFKNSNKQSIVDNAFQIMQEKHNWNEIAAKYKKVLCA